MSPAGPPPAVRRHLRQPLAWLAPAVGLVLALVLADVQAAGREKRERSSALRLDGVVEGSYRRGPDVPLRYRNPVTAQDVRTSSHVWDGEARPEAGQRVAILVAPDDPWAVALLGDAPPVTANPLAYLVLPAIPLAAWGMRWWRVHTTAALVGAPGATFAMLGALAPPGWLGRRSQLVLYPLDARPGAAPVCAVPLVGTAEVPFGCAFGLEVKGTPGPAGRVVARVGDRVLWPAGRVLLAARLPRPGDLASPADIASPPATILDSNPAGSGVVSGWWWRRATPSELLVALAAAAVAAAVAGVTLAHAAEARGLQRDGVAVVAQVTGHGDYHVFVSYHLEGRRRTGRAAADWPTDYEKGRRYPAKAYPKRLGQLRLDKEPYDTVEPIAWAGTPLLAVGLAALDRWRWWRRQRNVAARGPWRPATARVTGEAGGRARLALGAGAGRASCVARVPRGEIDPTAGNVAVEVAGELAPGACLALRVAGRPLAVAGPAAAPRLTELN